jgi:cyclohexanone monooxygenase
MRDDITFETRVVSTIFDEGSQRWVVKTDAGETVSAKFCIMATGLISAPVDPDFEGLENFAGEQYMTSRWPKDEPSFSGKRVGVVGTGSSGIQVISEVAKDVGELFVFQRTPAYTIPLQNHKADPVQAEKIKNKYADLRKLESQSFGGFTMMHSDLSPLPSKSALEVSADERETEYEDRWASGGLSPYYAYTDTLLDEESNQTLRDFAIKKMKERVDDPEVANKLIPDYEILTRRLSPETDYLETFNQDNVNLVDLREKPLERFTEKGIVVGGEEIELDVIIFATGFDVMTGAMDRIDIRGRDGQSLKDRWSTGLTSYLGMMTHGFPNYFWVNGPHSPFYNPILLAEYQGNLIFDAAKQLDSLGKDCIEARSESETAWVELTNTIGDMTLFPKSNNYYMGDNIPGKPRKVVFFFGGFVAYKEQCADGYTDLKGFLVS